jgi:hypothetical protein
MVAGSLGTGSLPCGIANADKAQNERIVTAFMVSIDGLATKVFIEVENPTYPPLFELL